MISYPGFQKAFRVIANNELEAFTKSPMHKHYLVLMKWDPFFLGEFTRDPSPINKLQSLTLFRKYSENLVGTKELLCGMASRVFESDDLNDKAFSLVWRNLATANYFRDCPHFSEEIEKRLVRIGKECSSKIIASAFNHKKDMETLKAIFFIAAFDQRIFEELHKDLTNSLEKLMKDGVFIRYNDFGSYMAFKYFFFSMRIWDKELHKRTLHLSENIPMTRTSFFWQNSLFQIPLSHPHRSTILSLMNEEKVTREAIVEGFFVDLFHKETKTIYEINGRYHYYNLERYTGIYAIKRRTLTALGYNVIDVDAGTYKEEERVQWVRSIGISTK